MGSLPISGFSLGSQLSIWEEFVSRMVLWPRGVGKRRGNGKVYFPSPFFVLGLFSFLPFFFFWRFLSQWNSMVIRSWRDDWEFSRKEEDETKERLCLVGRRTLMDNQDGKMGVCAHGDQGARICEGSAGVGEEAGFCWR